MPKKENALSCYYNMTGHNYVLYFSSVIEENLTSVTLRLDCTNLVKSSLYVKMDYVVDNAHQKFRYVHVKPYVVVENFSCLLVIHSYPSAAEPGRFVCDSNLSFLDDNVKVKLFSPSYTILRKFEYFISDLLDELCHSSRHNTFSFLRNCGKIYDE